MYPQSELTSEDWTNFLTTLRLAHMKDEDSLWRSVRAAYHSLNRTIHGVRKVPSIRYKAQMVLYNRLAMLRDKQEHITDQDSFDAWHQDTCLALIDTYCSNGYTHFSIGQAQKWINMSFKNMFALIDEHLIAFGEFYPYCHVPIDRIIISRLKSYGAPAISLRWSRLTDYAEYVAYQQWIRQSFSHVPLDIELLVYRGDDVSELHLPFSTGTSRV